MAHVQKLAIEVLYSGTDKRAIMLTLLPRVRRPVRQKCANSFARKSHIVTGTTSSTVFTAANAVLHPNVLFNPILSGSGSAYWRRQRAETRPVDVSMAVVGVGRGGGGEGGPTPHQCGASAGGAGRAERPVVVGGGGGRRAAAAHRHAVGAGSVGLGRLDRFG